jgi:hypothetical protein
MRDLEKPIFWSLIFPYFLGVALSYFYGENREICRVIDFLKDLFREPLKEL